MVTTTKKLEERAAGGRATGERRSVERGLNLLGSITETFGGGKLQGGRLEAARLLYKPERQET